MLKKIGKFLLIVIISAAVAGGGVYLWYSGMITEVKDKAVQTETELKNEIESLKDKTKIEPETIVKDPDYLPRIVFSPPGLFSESEKDMLNKNVIEPYTYYFKYSGDPVVSMMITKPTSTGEELASSYTINVIHKVAYAGFVYGLNKGQTEYPVWCPDCFDADCSLIPEEFIAKYPQIYDEALLGCPNYL